MPEVLTYKQKQFAEAYVLETQKPNGAAYKAALAVYDIKSHGNAELTARSIASENLSKPNIQRYISDLMDEHGLTDIVIIKALIEGINATKVVPLPVNLNNVNEIDTAVEILADTRRHFVVADYAVRLRYVELVAKLKGLYPEERAKSEATSKGQAWINEIKMAMGIQEVDLLLDPGNQNEDKDEYEENSREDQE